MQVCVRSERNDCLATRDACPMSLGGSAIAYLSRESLQILT